MYLQRIKRTEVDSLSLFALCSRAAKTPKENKKRSERKST